MKMAVGEIFLSAFLQVLFQQLASEAIKAFASYEKIESRFKKLSQSFKLVRAVLEDAEQKQLTDKFVQEWLESLRNWAYDLDDVLDEIMIRYLIEKSKGIEHHRTGLVWKFIPTCSRFRPSALVSNYRIMSKIKEIKDRLQYLVKQRDDLNLRENLVRTSNTVMRLPSTCLADSQVYGRDEDKEAIIKMLYQDEARQEDVSIIPIVGMGGIGKTTLAQLVYNDRTVKHNFHVRAWVCVSEVFDVLMITKTIYKAVTELNGDAMDLNMLQVNLLEKLSKSKFLIVLDDVWNENYADWDVLYRPLKVGLPGSRIIVTTRNETVASVIGSPQIAYHMKLLTDDDCLALLTQHSCKSFVKNSNLQEVGLGLMRKCKGLPLAAKTLGGLLRSKGTKEELEAVLNSKIWDLPKEHNILPVLRLSYHHLPQHLKPLFAYCSIFPKDYEFDKNELVLLWMGEGFLEKTKDGKPKEDLGNEYFNDLLSRSFFQRLSDCESFLMHDLINDLAQSVVGGTCYRLDEKMDTNQEYPLPDKTRHVSFLRHEYEVFRKFKAFSKVQGLRTFLPMPVQNSRPFYLSNEILVKLVPELPRLRVLSLSGYSITELPSSTICHLIHLRYLNLSGTSILTLPDLSDLYCLETLSLCNCRFIINLPPTLGNLLNLRHLDISGTDQLKDMPVEIGKLHNLQTLPKVVQSRTGGLGLKELGKLMLLRGKLAVLELQNVTDIQDVKDAQLSHKDGLDELQLTWGNKADEYRNRSLEEDVLDFLEPQKNLRNLKIEFYEGAKFPSWIGDLSFLKLSTLIIRGCINCTFLPPLGQLPELKVLHIIEMPKIKSIGSEFYGNGIAVPFPKLEILRFSDMPGWVKWSFLTSDAHIYFPQLHQLAILKCERLTNISPLSFPVLHELDLEECSTIMLEKLRNLDSLNYLKVESITGLSNIPIELMQSLEALEVLECCNCNDLVSLCTSEIPFVHLISLRRLVIADCSQLVSVGEGEHQLPIKIEVLEIFRCANLTSLPDDLSNLGSLRELIVKNCPKLIRFPVNGIPPMLKRLEILSCNALESLPSNILNLERMEIKECSSLKTWAMDNFPADLKKLSIKNCRELESVTDMMFPRDIRISLEELSLCNWLSNDLLNRLNGFSKLVELSLSTCKSLKHIHEKCLPPHLRALSIEDCPKLKSLPERMRNMTSLLSLEIRSCPRLDNFPGCDLPPNLSSLRILDSKKFSPLREWGLHRLTSLREFTICGGFRELNLLGEDLFPPSLTKFSIARFPELNSLANVLENLILLQHLSIVNCAKLNDLPSYLILEKLWHLEISECALLSMKCAKHKGDYWPRISGIPCVEIK